MPNFRDPIKVNGTEIVNENGKIVKGSFLKAAVISGGSAGAHTVTGITTSDELVLVLQVAGAGTDVTDIADLTSEFSITAGDTINNTGGTDTTGGKLLVLYLDLS